MSSDSAAGPDDKLRELIELGRVWLLEQRDLYMAAARPLSEREKRALEDYYERDILDKVGVAVVDRIANPEFYDELKEAGYPVFDISIASGITLADCIVIRRQFEQYPPIWTSILFHELVHALHYEILGTERLVESYLVAWAENGHQYDLIPFEEQAHRLEARFSGNEPPFSVREIVEGELRQWGYLT